MSKKYFFILTFFFPLFIVGNEVDPNIRQDCYEVAQRISGPLVRRRCQKQDVERLYDGWCGFPWCYNPNLYVDRQGLKEAKEGFKELIDKLSFPDYLEKLVQPGTQANQEFKDEYWNLVVVLFLDKFFERPENQHFLPDAMYEGFDGPIGFQIEDLDSLCDKWLQEVFAPQMRDEILQ